MQFCGTIHIFQIKSSDIASVPEVRIHGANGVKLRRKLLRSVRKGYSDKKKEKGVDSYAAGAF